MSGKETRKVIQRMNKVQLKVVLLAIADGLTLPDALEMGIDYPYYLYGEHDRGYTRENTAAQG